MEGHQQRRASSGWAALHPKFRFRCPGCVPAGEEEDQYRYPCNCPEQIPQPRFPSPTSSLPPGEFAEVKACIEKANALLLALGVEREEENQRTLQLSIRKLRKQRVKALMDCKEKKEKVFGRLVDAGRDFIILQIKDNILLIPFARIISLQHVEDTEGLELEQELIDIDHCFRKSLTLHFSEVVTRSPFLINLFYGLDLNVFLESFVGCHIFVSLEDEKEGIKGTLIKTGERAIEVKIKGEKKGAFFDGICFIAIKYKNISHFI